MIDLYSCSQSQLQNFLQLLNCFYFLIKLDLCFCGSPFNSICSWFICWNDSRLNNVSEDLHCTPLRRSTVCLYWTGIFHLADIAEFVIRVNIKQILIWSLVTFQSMMKALSCSVHLWQVLMFNFSAWAVMYLGCTLCWWRCSCDWSPSPARFWPFRVSPRSRWWKKIFKLFIRTKLG